MITARGRGCSATHCLTQQPCGTDELKIDLRGGSTDGVVVWNMPLAINGISTREGIFSEHKLQPAKATPVKGWADTAALISYWPSGQPGYFGWFTRFVSRQLLPTALHVGDGHLAIAFKHSMQKKHEGKTLFSKTIYMRSHASGSVPTMVLYLGPAAGPGCPTVGDSPCPGWSRDQHLLGRRGQCQLHSALQCQV